MKSVLGLAFLLILVVVGIYLLLESQSASPLTSPSNQEPDAEIALKAVLAKLEGTAAEAESPTMVTQAEMSQLPDTALSPQRVPASEPTEQQTDLHVFGSVVDQRGLPLPETEVTLLAGGSIPPPHPYSSLRWNLSPDQSTEPVVRILKKARTDALGAFDMGVITSSQLKEAHLAFASELFLGNPPSAPLIPDGSEQYLQLPKGTNAALELSILAPEGSLTPPYPEWATLDLIHLGEGVTGAPRQFDSKNLIVGAGRLLAHSLSPGTWSVWVRCRDHAPTHLEVDVHPGPERTQATLVLTAAIPQTRYLNVHRPTFEGDLPQQDPTYGFDKLEVPGQGPRKFRESGSDLWFAHTIEGFGQGVVRSAYLEIELEAEEYSMTPNDGLNLEFRGWDARPRWAYGSRIESLPGGNPWRGGQRRRFFLDLSALPKKDGFVNLLSELEDGRLDIFVSDDTAVHDVALHVSH